jgi:hypothetical protein
MPGFDGKVPAGMGPLTGGGRGLCNPRGRMIGGFFGLPRRLGFVSLRNMPGSLASENRSTSARMSRGLELDLLKRQAETMKNELNTIETRINDLLKEKK